MDDISRKVLRTVHGVLDRLTRTQNLAQDQLTEVFMASTALDYEIARTDYPADIFARVQAIETKLAGGINPSSARPRGAAEGWEAVPGAALCAIEAGALGDDPATRARIRELLVAYHSQMDRRDLLGRVAGSPVERLCLPRRQTRRLNPIIEPLKGPS